MRLPDERFDVTEQAITVRRVALSPVTSLYPSEQPGLVSGIEKFDADTFLSI